MDSSKKILFIINPISGVGKQKNIEQQIAQYLNLDIYEYSIAYTQAPNHAVELSKDAVEKKYDIVVVVGGDGSVNEVAKGLVDSDTALGIIPVGSGNGLAHHLSIPLHIPDAIDVINNYNILSIDTGYINKQLFVSIAGIGFDALVANEFAKCKTRGFWSYFQITMREYMLYRPKRYKIFIEGKVIKRKALFISFANSNQFGYNISIAPKAIINDGYIDVCIFKKAPFFLVPYIASMMFIKKINETHFIEVIKAKDVRIISKKMKIVHIDGDPFNISKELILKVNPASLKVIVPKTINN